jgi:hypothetical protein
MTDAVVESDNEREEGQGRWSSALDMPGDVVENGDATAQGEEQYGQQGADGPQAPCSAGGMLSGLCPNLLAGVAGLDIVESECDIGCGGRLGGMVVIVMGMMSATGRPGLGGDEREAGQEQQDSDCVQGLVEGKRVVYGRCGAQIGRC